MFILRNMFYVSQFFKYLILPVECYFVHNAGITEVKGQG